MSTSDSVFGADRRTMLAGAAATAALLSSRGAFGAAAADDTETVRQAIKANHAEAVKRLQEWIAHPSIAAEKRNGQEGAEYMRQLALDVGFQHAEVAKTKGQPGVFATMDNGAP